MNVRRYLERLRGTMYLRGGGGGGWKLGSGSFHSFLPRIPLASSTFSQRLKEARCRQDNHHLIRGDIESRLALIHYKLERRVHTNTHWPHVHTSTCICTHTHTVRCNYGALWHISERSDHLQSVHIRTSMCTKNITLAHKHTKTHTRSFFLLLTWVLYPYPRKMLAHGKRYE